MLQVAEDADGEDVPRCALVAHKDEILRLLQGFRIGIFHLALFIQVGKFARKRHKHLNVKKRAIGKGLAQIGQRRSVGKQVFLPRDLLLEFLVELAACWLAAAWRCVQAGNTQRSCRQGRAPSGPSDRPGCGASKAALRLQPASTLLRAPCRDRSSPAISPARPAPA